MNLPDNVLVLSEKILEVKLYQWQARINRLGLKRGNSMQKLKNEAFNFGVNWTDYSVFLSCGHWASCAGPARCPLRFGVL
jgi:hypothetical protein